MPLLLQYQVFDKPRLSGSHNKRCCSSVYPHSLGKSRTRPPHRLRTLLAIISYKIMERLRGLRASLSPSLSLSLSLSHTHAMSTLKREMITHIVT
jgi:hypothetical protein